MSHKPTKTTLFCLILNILGKSYKLNVFFFHMLKANVKYYDAFISNICRTVLLLVIYVDIDILIIIEKKSIIFSVV